MVNHYLVGLKSLVLIYSFSTFTGLVLIGCGGCFCKEFDLVINHRLLYDTQLQYITVNSSLCRRSWLTNQDTMQLKETLIKLVNIRNISYAEYQNFYEICKEKIGKRHKYCPILYRSPFYLKWTFSSVVTCSSSSNKLFLHLYISFETTKTKLMSRHQPVSHTLSFNDKSVSIIVKLYSPNYNAPDVMNAARFRNMRDFYNINVVLVAIAKLTLELLSWHNLTYILLKDSNKFEKEALIPGIHVRILLTQENSSIYSLRNRISYEISQDASAGSVDGIM